MVEKNFPKITQHAAQTGVLTESMHTSPSVSEACAATAFTAQLVAGQSLRLWTAKENTAVPAHQSAVRGSPGRPTAHCGRRLCSVDSSVVGRQPSTAPSYSMQQRSQELGATSET